MTRHMLGNSVIDTKKHRVYGPVENTSKMKWRSLDGSTAAIEEYGVGDRRISGGRIAAGALFFGKKGAALGALASKNQSVTLIRITGGEADGMLIDVNPKRRKTAVQLVERINRAAEQTA